MLAEKEKLLNEAYQQFIQFGLGNLPIEMYETIVAENYMGYGTAMDEKLFSAIDLRDLVMRQMEQGQGMDMKFAETPVFRRISVREDVAIIVAEILVTILVESSRHDLFLRMTTIMEFLNGKWIAVHSHGSKPETTLGETDTWHINEWKRKNEELQKLVDEKTADLSDKNRELVIETCLERVRTQAMSMKEPGDMLDVCRVISDQLTLLGVKEIRNVQTAIIYADKGKYLNFEYYRLHDKKIITEVDYTLHKAQEDFANQMLTGPEAFHESHFSGKELSDWVAYQSTTPQFVDSYLYKAESLNYYFYSMGPVALGVTTYVPLKAEDLNLVKRFRNVFELAYTRFLDIQQAEAQAKEAQIELALERVRARTMAMQHSEELKDAANLLFLQVQSLGIPAWSCGYNIWEKNEKEYTGWMSTQGSIQPSFKIPLTENPTFIRQFESRQRGDLFYAEEVRGQALVDHYNYMKSLPDFKPILEGFIHAGYSLPESQVNNVANFSHGHLIFITNKPVPESWDIFKRFAKVFEQTYTRFLDLQKAEAQAREAKIENTLERVRSQSLAMHRSEELEQVVGSLFDQLVELGLLFDGASIFLFEQKKRNIHLWVASKISTPLKVMMPYDEYIMANQIIIDLWNANEKGEDIINKSYSGGVKDDYIHYIAKYNELIIPEWIRKMMFEAESWTVSYAVEKNSLVCIDSWSGQFITDENFQVVKRFARVFEQAYTRFLDLQKAEAQARDAEIELALERVRARTMAMQKSDELPDAANLLFQQMQTLGMPAWSAGYCIWDEDKQGITLWMSSEGVIQPPFRAPLTEDPTFIHIRETYERGGTFHVAAIGGEELIAHYKYMRTLPVVGQILDSIIEAGHPLPTFQIMHCAYFSQGFLLFITYEPIPQAWDIFKRFSIVFDQTYTRFLDLQKAELQARESQIEASLEKVRSRTMAMQKSDELADAAYVLFQQLNHLGVIHERINIGIVKEEAHTIDFWVTEQGGNQINTRFSASLKEPTTISKVYAAWKAGQKSKIVDITGEELKAWLKYLTEVIGIPFDPAFMHNRRVQTAGFFSKGMLVLTTPEPLPEESIHLIEKFAGVFDLTYTRFNDLLLAEAQTHKANIEVALERVRARALAMQEPEELIEVAQVLRHEMGLLGVEELETSSIYLHDENSDTVECWYAISDLRHPGKKLVADQITIDLQKTGVGRQMFDFYQSDKTQISILMQGDNRIEWIKYCASVSTVLGDFYGDVIPDRTYHLYKFSNGAIGAASAGDISTESWELLSRTASVFSLAYSRFKDLTKARVDLQRLKEEKQRAELALTDLKAAQAQLVQAEKMASLGELTAGIAHEIQNPLNFVNNFSELSNELIEEMQEELDKGNNEEVKNIVSDIRNNLEKINLHGKRADAIVKGMLQHSRTTSGEKQLTDINALADEYLRLAYHGLQAKDKNFNATLKTEFDPAIGKINIIPQDIGRVLLNLINNAFYAVNERSKEAVNGYQPEVIVSTRLLTASDNSLFRQSANSIIISVKDNGNGIPEHVLDKVFQPFFTTKPTGQGTGLGLSLSYDIVKAHGGEIILESKENVGSEFIIWLSA